MITTYFSDHRDVWAVIQRLTATLAVLIVSLTAGCSDEPSGSLPGVWLVTKTSYPAGAQLPESDVAALYSSDFRWTFKADETVELVQEASPLPQKPLKGEWKTSVGAENKTLLEVRLRDARRRMITIHGEISFDGNDQLTIVSGLVTVTLMRVPS